MAATVIPKADMLNQKGLKFAPCPRVTLDQSRIDAFADCTEDHQFIHVHEKRAAATPFGGTITHGLLTLSTLVELCEPSTLTPENTVMGINYGFNKVRFLAPVRSGKRVRAQVQVEDVTRKDEQRFLITDNVTVAIEGEKTPALIAEWLALVVTA